MDFVEWCDFVLTTCIKTGQTVCIDEFSLAETLSIELGIPDFRKQPNSSQSTYIGGTHFAIQELQNVGLMENYLQRDYLWSVSRAGRDHVRDKTLLWWQICQEKLDVEHEQVLHIVNQLSPKKAQDHAWLEMVNHEAIVAKMSGTEISSRLWPIAYELKQWGFVSGWFSAASTVNLQSTYKGLVWETRRGFTLESKFIDDLVAEWETTSVDFKQYLYIKSVEQKAEFIKDVLSLANTQASGRRWLIIGFDNKTHDYFGPPEASIRQDDLERLVAEYIDPCVELRYEAVNYRKGPVGKLEIVRDRKKVPYRVAKSLGDKLKGDKKQIFQGQIFVRHGSQVQEPTDLELQALQEEGDRARLV